MIEAFITTHNIIAWSLLGGAAKTHDDYKKKKVGKVKLLIALVINLIYAVIFGYMAVVLWHIMMPTMGAISFIISFTAGFIGANVIAIIKRIDWLGYVEGFISKWTK